MVNGKPNLTFGGAAPVSDAKARQRTYIGGRNADNFASFLPPELGKSGGASPSAQNAQGAQSPLAQGSAGIPTRRFVPQQQTAETSVPSAQMPLSPGSANSLNPLSGAVAQPAAAVPASRQSRVEARALGQPGLQGMLPQNTMMQPQRVPKSAPRISGTPITGRHNIGMVDTRKIGGIENPNTGRPAFTPENLALRNANAQSSLPANSAYNRYTAMIGNLGGLQSPQSFVSHGFAGTNAVLAMKQLGYDVQEARSITTHAQKLEPNPYGLNNRTTSPARTSRQNSRNQAANRMNAAEAPTAGTYPNQSLVPGFYNAANKGLGDLAAKFESGRDGIAAIGYDRKGGTSYGKYQIASRVGTMDAFLSYLQDKAPDLAGRLKAAGPANTGGRNGQMPTEWRKIAAEQPERFERLQSDFIHTSHFAPAMRGIAQSTGLAFDKMPKALQEVLFSTAVQHGPAGATRIINQAVEQVGAQKLKSSGDGKKSAATRKAEEQLITQIYNLRAGQFVSSTAQVQSSVRNRLKQEMREAIQMLS
jgi:lysozyme family protein